MKADRLTALETSFLWFERPGRPIHVGAVATFEGAPLLDDEGHLRLGAIRTLVGQRVDELPRLRQTVMPSAFGLDRPHWADDPDFDVADHVREVRVPVPGGEAELRRAAEHVHAELFDPDHPPWDLCFVTGLADGRVGLVERVHHALVDGMGGVDLAAVFLDVDRAGRPQRDPQPRPLAAPIGSPLMDVARGWLQGASEAAGGVASALRHPGSTVRGAAGVVRGLATVVEDGVVSPGASLNVPAGSRRRLEWIRARLDAVKEVGHAAGGTVNDVVLAAVTTGLRELLVERGVPVTRGLTLKALVPVSERDAEEMPTLGNRVSGVLAPLPVGDGEPEHRLAAIVSSTRRLKASGESAAVDAFLHTADLLPAPVARLLVGGVEHQPFVNLVVTNVPGPPCPLYLNGAELLEAFPVVPLGANLSVGVAILSYNGALNIGVTADADACPDVEVFANGIADGLAQLGASQRGML